MSEPAVCAACSAPFVGDERFCTKCGAPKQSAATVAAKRRVARMDAEERRKQIGKAARWIMILAVLFALSGTLMGWLAKRNGQEALGRIADRDAAEVVELQDEPITIGELRQRVVGEYVAVFVLNYVLAAVFVALFFWARKSPLPATITALCVFLAVQVFNALLDPATIVQGILVKLFCVIALVAGIRAALAARAAEARTAGPVAA